MLYVNFFADLPPTFLIIHYFLAETHKRSLGVQIIQFPKVLSAFGCIDRPHNDNNSIFRLSEQLTHELIGSEQKFFRIYYPNKDEIRVEITSRKLKASAYFSCARKLTEMLSSKTRQQI